MVSEKVQLCAFRLAETFLTDHFHCKLQFQWHENVLQESVGFEYIFKEFYFLLLLMFFIWGLSLYSSNI